MEFQALPFAEPATGLVYARARWYDLGTGSFLTPDPEGYIDSSNLYAFGGGDPVNNRDPLGEAILVNPKVARDFLRGAWESTKSVAGFVVGVGESAIETVHGLNPIVSNSRTIKAAVPRAQRVAAAYRSGGTGAAARQYGAEVRDHVTGVLQGLPIVNTVRQASAIPEAYEAGSFAGGRQVGRTTFSAAGDVTIVYGGVKGAQQMRAPKPAPASAPLTAEIEPGQVASAYPRDRRVGGRGEGVRAADPPGGFRESGAFELTPDNIRLMESGRPPIGRDGLPVELHHRGQNPAGPLDEMTSTSHDLVPHPISPSQINRSKFAGERARYWRQRVRELHGQQ